MRREILPPLNFSTVLDGDAGFRAVERIMSCAPSELVDSQKPDDGQTALHLACSHGFRDIAELLIQQVQHRNRLQ